MKANVRVDSCLPPYSNPQQHILTLVIISRLLAHSLDRTLVTSQSQLSKSGTYTEVNVLPADMLELDPYQKNLAGLLLVCGTLLATGSSAKGRLSAEDVKRRQYGADYRGSQWAFYVVYALVMASDWLQVRPPPNRAHHSS